MKLLSLAALTLAVTASAVAAVSDPLDVLRDERARSASATLVANLDGAPVVAARAALALGRTKRSVALNALRAHLVTGDASVRAMVAFALGLQADAASLGALRGLAKRDGSSAVRYAAVDAVGRIASVHREAATRETADALLAVLDHDADATVRGHAAANLDAFTASPFAGTIVHRLTRAFDRERDPAVRWHVMWVVFRGYATRTDPAFLRRALKDPEELVRVEAVRAWARRASDPGALAAVRPLLADPSWRVAFEANEATLRLSKKPATEHLTAVPSGVRLPPIAPVTPATVSPRPAAASSPAAPRVEDVPSPVALLPQTASDMNGPAPGAHPRVRIRTTRGDVVVALYPEWAPLTVANFLNLSARGYFNGNRFFRIVPDFVVQTGDPHDDGEGDAGYSIGAEENPVEQRSGIIAMGLNYDKHGPERDSAGTQFYVTLSPQLHLDRDFTVFGEIESGFDVLANLLENDRMVDVERVTDGPPPRVDPMR